MKKVIVLLLCMLITLTGCSSPQVNVNVNQVENVVEEELVEVNSLEFTGLNDEKLLTYVEDLVYMNTVEELNSEEYVVEEVRANYISKEYIDELEYNSNPNMYFGYTLEELDDYFQGKRYIFTLDENGKTTVKELEELVNDDSLTIAKNIAMGGGVILVTVTVSAVAPVVGAPAAITSIFTVSANAAKTFAMGSSIFGGITAGIVEGYKTGDVNKAFDAALVSASEGFKWGAISGAVTGAGAEAFILKTGTKSGLTMSEVAMIQADSKLPIDIISEMHSIDEYMVYKQANLKTAIVNGKTALIQDFDLKFVSELSDGTPVSNVERMQLGYAPIDATTGEAYQLHHIGQKSEGTLAVLTGKQHQGNSTILNIAGKDSEINRKEFAKIRKEFWMDLGNQLANGGI